MSAKSYWLDQGNSSPSGPFARSQLVAMWTSGGITVDDTICEVGKSKWVSAQSIEDWLPGAKAENSGCIATTIKTCVNLALIASAIGAVIYFGFGAGLAPETKEIADRELTTLKWVREHLADPDASVSGVTAEYVLRGERYFAVFVHGKNAFGGPISEVFIMHDHGSNIVSGYRPKEMRDNIDNTKRKLSSADAAELEAEYAAMCHAFGLSAH